MKLLLSWSSGKDSAWALHCLQRRGEFHTFVCAGPMFRHPIAIEGGEVVERDGFAFADVRPAAPLPATIGA